MNNSDFSNPASLYEAVVQATGDAIIAINLRSIMIFTNQSIERLVGYTPEELIGRPLTMLMNRSDQARHEKGMSAFLASGKRNMNWSGIELTLLHKDGSLVSTEVSFGEYTQEGQRLFAGSFRDTSEKKRAEELFKDDFIRVKQVAENLQEVIWMTDIEKQTMVYISPGYERIWGRSCTSLYEDAMSFVRAIHPDDRDRIIARFEDQKTGKYDVEYRIVQPGGGVRWIHDRAFPVSDPNGKVYRICGIASDITPKKEAGELLAKSEAFLASLIENVPLMVYAKDQQGRHILSNRTHAEAFGLQPGILIGKTDQECFPAELSERFRQTDLEAINSKEPIEFKDAFNGRHFVTTKFPLVDSFGAIYAICGITADVTDRINSERALDDARMKSVMSAKMAALGEMAGGIAHEINNPLAIIHGKAAQLRRIAEESELKPELVIDFSERIEVTALRFSKIVKSLRSFARDAEQDPFEHVLLQRIIEETVEFCHERFRDHQITIRKGAIPGALTLDCRPVQLMQVLLNLLNNAHDAVEKLAERWVEIAVEDQGHQIQISVTDSGSGIPASVRAKIMEPFFTTKEVGRGTGLGLSVSKGIVESHSGSLRVDETSPNTRFLVHLPKEQKDIQKL